MHILNIAEKKDIEKLITEGRLIFSCYETEEDRLLYDIVFWDYPSPHTDPRLFIQNIKRDGFIVLQTDLGKDYIEDFFESAPNWWKRLLKRPIDPDNYFSPSTLVYRPQYSEPTFGIYQYRQE